MANSVSVEMRAVFGPTMQRAHDSTHYEGCWKDHWPCALEKALDEIDRLQIADHKHGYDCPIHGLNEGSTDCPRC